MSAYFSVPFADRVEILTDGALYDRAGVLVGSRHKVQAIDHPPMAIFGRGDVGMLTALAEIVTAEALRVASFDDALVNFAGQLPRIQRVVALPRSRHIEMVIAGISEEMGPCHFLWTSSPDLYRDVEPYHLHHPEADLIAGPSIDLAELLKLMPEITASKLNEGLGAWGVRLFDLMRGMKGANLSDPATEMYGIGAHLDLTIVRAAGVSTERLCTWPDIVGELIDPSRGPILSLLSHPPKGERNAEH